MGKRALTAAYFEGIDELLKKISCYMSREDERRRIADVGRARRLAGGYSYDARFAIILDALEPQRWTTRTGF